MSWKRCLGLAVVCALLMGCWPGTALAANYNAAEICDNEDSVAGVVFKSGDKLTRGNGATIVTVYVDANGNEVERGDSTIKSVVINGKKCSEWVMTDSSGSITITPAGIFRGMEFTFTPTYAVADAEGYYSLNADTFSMYSSQEGSTESASKKVKFAGTVVAEEEGTTFVSIGDNAVIAVTKAEDATWSAVLNTRVQGKGEIASTALYQDASVPMVVCMELNELKYDPLRKGDNKKEVLEMKIRMQELGYFRAGASLSESYNAICVERVQMFQQQNGLPVTGEADSETLAVLFSDAAVPNE